MFNFYFSQVNDEWKEKTRKLKPRKLKPPPSKALSMVTFSQEPIETMTSKTSISNDSAEPTVTMPSLFIDIQEPYSSGIVPNLQPNGSNLQTCRSANEIDDNTTSFANKTLLFIGKCKKSSITKPIEEEEKETTSNTEELSDIDVQTVFDPNKPRATYPAKTKAAMKGKAMTNNNQWHAGATNKVGPKLKAAVSGTRLLRDRKSKGPKSTEDCESKPVDLVLKNPDGTLESFSVDMSVSPELLEVSYTFYFNYL
jgi:hypothetical protein